MRLHVCAVMDLKVGAYSTPFYARTRAEAVRMFVDACADKGSQLFRNAEDFALHWVGEFDDNTGQFTSAPAPTPLLTGLEARLANESKSL